MKIVEQSCRWTRSAPELPLKLIEVIARTCYKSEEAIGPGTAAQMVRGLLRRNHGAMIEHAHASVRFITDRGVTHEMVRHRIASYAQESTRYCNYSKVKFGKTVASHPPYAPAESNFLSACQCRDRRCILLASAWGGPEP